jgi:hypothetical protein
MLRGGLPREANESSLDPSILKTERPRRHLPLIDAAIRF